MENLCIIIPARLNSSRLPRKMLLEIDNKPLLYYTWKKAVDSNIGDVFIAAADEEIIEKMNSYNAKSFLIPKNLNSGTDAVYFCYKNCLSEKYKYIINLQGDTPNIPVYYIEKVLEPVYYFDIGTLCYKTDLTEAQKDQVVKVVFNNFRNDIAKALYFSRSLVPHGAKTFYHHVGIYSFTKQSLERFCSLKQSYLESVEKLEQLRALENDMSIGVKIVEKENVYGIDTIEDFNRYKNDFSKYK